MKAILILVFILISASVFSKENSTATSCGHHDYPPWNWYKGNELKGACEEAAREIFKRVGVKVSPKFVGPWHRCQQKVSNGEIDINICAFKNPAREQYSYFIPTVLAVNENAVFVRKDKHFSFSKWKDLNNKRIGIVIGVSIGKKFDSFIKTHRDVQKLHSYTQIFKMIKSGRVDVVIVGRMTGKAILKKMKLHEEIIDLERPVLSGKLFISISKKSPQMKHIKAIDELLQRPGHDEWFKSLLKKYVELYAN